MIWVYAGIAVITLVLGYLLMQSMGLVGIGYAWVVGNVVVAGGIGIMAVKEKFK